MGKSMLGKTDSTNGRKMTLTYSPQQNVSFSKVEKKWWFHNRAMPSHVSFLLC